MKKILKYILITILIFPMFIEAATYDDAKSIVNTFISRYDDYDRYFSSGTSDFLTKEEYELSKVGHYSYLASGTAFWLMDTENNKKCILSDTLNCTNPTSANAKVTQNIKPAISVTGSGSQTDPWEFIGIYKLYVNTNDVSKGTVTPNNIELVNSVDSKYTYTVTAKTGYEYLGTECSNGKSFDKTTNTFVIENINEDTSCKVIFGNKNIIVTLDHNGGSGESLLSELYYKYNSAWYSDNALSNKISKIDNLPTKAGYAFNGYYTKDASGNLNKQVIDAEGNIITEHKLFSSDVTIYAKWTSISKPVRIYYNMYGGSYNGTSNLTYSESYIACNSSTQSVIDSNGYSSGCDSSNNYYYDVVNEGGTINLSDYDNSSWIKITNKSTKHVTPGREWWFYPQNDSNNDWDVLSDSTNYSYNTLKGYAEDMGDHYKLIVYTNWYTTYYCYFNTGYSYVTLWNYSNSNTKSVMVYNGTYGLDGIYIEKTYSDGWRYIGCHSELSSYRWSYFMSPGNFTSCVEETRCYRGG